MKKKKFLGKLISPFVMWNLTAMAILTIVTVVAVAYGLSVYTHHGEGIEVPDLCGKNIDDMERQMQQQGITIEVSDTGYNKRMPADCILTQTPEAGTKVKTGRTVFVTINSTSKPMMKIPDIIDNCSFREAQAKLTAIGFLVEEPQLVDGERDWVYGVKTDGRSLQVGDKVPVETKLTLQIGRGSYEEDSDDAMLDMPFNTDESAQDDFEEVVE